MADTVAIVSIASGATVAVLVPFINSTLEKSRLAWQAHQRRLDDLRPILEDALAPFVRARITLDDAFAELNARARELKQELDFVKALHDELVNLSVQTWAEEAFAGLGHETEDILRTTAAKDRAELGAKLGLSAQQVRAVLDPAMADAGREIEAVPQHDVRLRTRLAGADTNILSLYELMITIWRGLRLNYSNEERPYFETLAVAYTWVEALRENEDKLARAITTELGPQVPRRHKHGSMRFWRR